jgi:CO/xanthine dehydrogenase Mo-binding subunit
MKHFEIVGTSPPRMESVAKVRGQALYLDDLPIPGVVHGKILRSPFAHARVLDIDASEAMKVPGVMAVLLPSDVHSRRFNSSGNPPSGLIVSDERILTDHPLHVGDRVAAVAGETPESCVEAIRRIRVEYEPLPAVTGIEEAMAEGAPILHPDLFNSNVFRKLEARDGDVDAGFRESDHIFEEEYYTPTVQHVPMEPVGCVCSFGPDGRLTVWCNTQAPFQDRRILAELLDLPESWVRIIKPVMGGGFGARQQLHNQHVAALLSRRIHRPVKILNTREEEMYATAVRHACIVHLKAGVGKDGRLRAFHARVYANTGAYCTHGPIVLGAQSRKFHYRVPHYLFEGSCVYTNAPVAGAMRGYGNPQLTFARELFLDKIARNLGMDPLAFRLVNQLKVGERIPAHTFPLRSCAVEECVAAAEAVKREIDAAEASRKLREGSAEAWGIAFACHTSGPSNNEGLSSSVVMVNDDGSANLLVGSVDMGQGCETTFCQIAAEALGVALEDVSISAADTLHTPYDTGSFASSQIYVGGNAVHDACQDAREKLKAALAERFQVSPDAVFEERGSYEVRHPDGKTTRLGFKEAVSRVSFGPHGAVLVGRSSFKAQESPPPFAVCWAKVEVHLRTRHIRVRHIIQAVDVGQAINPQVVVGQVEGGISMGLGYALMEEVEIDPRLQKPTSSDLLHYRIPTVADMPRIHVRIVEGFEPTGPFGAKSVGELPAVPVAPAIANAITQATGEEIHRLPLRREWLTGVVRVRGKDT